MTSTKSDTKTLQQAHLDSIIDCFNQRTAASKRSAQTYRSIMADKSSLGLGFSPELKEVCYPIVAQRSSSSRLWDIDNNEYVDILMGLGINLLGHNPPFVKAAIEAQLEKGIAIAPQAELAGEVAQLICELTGVDRVTFSNTGTEAIMTAIRLARAATNRNKIAIFTNSYHGHSDYTLVRATLSEYAKKAVGRWIAGRSWLQPLQSMLTATLNPKAVPAAIGIPSAVAETVLVLNYGDPRSLEIIEANKRDLAAVLVEPVQSRCPQLQPKEFLQQLRSITQSAGIALVFDEMVTGFRIHPGGAQAWFDVKADLVTYSKIVGGGLPMSVIAGKSDYLDRIDGGSWNFGDSTAPQVKTTFFAGTFCKHPLALATAKAMLEHLKNEGESLQDNLNQRTQKLVERLNDEMRSLPIQFTHFGSFFAVDSSRSTASPIALNLLSYHLLNRGVHLRQGDKGGFLSTAHTETDVEFIIQMFVESANALNQNGFFA